MAFQKRDNSGIVSENQYKKLDKHPDITGNATIGGVDYRVAGWKKEGLKGPFISISFTPEEDMGEERSFAPKQSASPSRAMFKAPIKQEVIEDEIDDEIPF
jgi:hypothetical protein